MNPHSLSKRQLQALKTRDNLLVAGRKLFLTYGFQKTTMTQVNKEAHTGYGTAYVYFKNKDELLLEVLKPMLKQMYEVAEMPFKPNNFQEAFDQIYLQVARFIQCAVDERAMMQVLHEAIGQSESIRLSWQTIQHRFIESIVSDIQTVQNMQLARPTLDPSILAKGWFFMNEQLMWSVVLGKEQASIEDIAKQLTEMYTKGIYAH